MPVKFKEMPTTFYLGRRYDSDSRQVTNEPIYYDSRDLTTHAVVVGMTGSGKTGLCISLLEEAILDNIPAVIIDPKGDITNLLLQFPDMRPEDFRPWINVDDARREHMEPDEYAQVIAQKWREGLTESGIVPGRIQALKNAAEFSIYTPGSDAGLPVSILDSLQAPREGWTGYEEAHRERINGTVTALLALIGKNADPVKDREHVLIANLFEDAWKMGQNLTLEQIILQVQKPPFAKLGVFEVDTFFPQKDRFKLAKELNQIVAAPSFQTWMQGEPLDMRHLMYSASGKPHVSIFYIAHLNDAERTFMITLLLENTLSWMRTLSGTTTLRSLLYFDEVFGYFPPSPYNPPTKGPLLRLLKQARAFGIGVILATQNPVDLDYKGLANAGTWFIGKLQTDNDRKRMLGGLEAAASVETQIDLKKMDRMITQLDRQMFILHNVHSGDGPIQFKTRWAMSYLRGPLTRQQVRVLMETQRAAILGRAQEFAAQYTAPQGNALFANPPPAQPLPALTDPSAPVSPAAGLFSTGRAVPPLSTPPNTARPQDDQLFTTGTAVLPSGLPPPPPSDPESSRPANPFGTNLLDMARRANATPPPAQPVTPPIAPATILQPTPPPAEYAPGAGQGLTVASSSIAPVSSTGTPRNLPEGYQPRPASLGGNTAQYFLPALQATKDAVRNWEQKFGVQVMSMTDAVLLYRPMLLAQAMARYLDRKANVQEDQLMCFQVPDLDRAGFINWDQYGTLPVDPNTVLPTPPDNAWYGDIPAGLSDAKRLTALKAEVIDHVYRAAHLPLFYNATLDLYGVPNETKRDYSIRLQNKAREARDLEIEKVTAKFDKDLEALDARLRKEMREQTGDLRQLEELKREETYTTGEAVFSLMRGRPSYTLSRMSRARRYKTNQQERAFTNEQQITDLEQALDAKQEELREALNLINQKWAKIATTIEETKLTPFKKDIAVQLFGIGWVPAWSLSINGQPVIISAT